VNLGSGARLEPNQRTTTTELFDGLEATSQNHWPSLEFDVGVVNNYVARFLPAGFYYKTFIHPRAAGNTSSNRSSGNRRVWARHRATVMQTVMNRLTPFATFWSWAGVSPGFRRPWSPGARARG
jgi:hypothetical protein